MIKHWDFGAIECGITATEISQIYKKAMKTLKCEAFRDEKNSQKAVEMYEELFENMMKEMEICQLNDKQLN